MSEQWDILFAMRQAYSKCCDPICRKYELTQMELSIIMLLDENPDRDTAQDIVNQWYLAKSHVSVSIDQLQKKGFLTREQDTANRKKYHLILSASTGPVIKDARAARDAFLLAIERGMNEEERRQFHNSLTTLLANLKEYIEQK